MLLLLFSLPSGCFNSRSREGSDCVLVAHVVATTSFNSRSREGSDLPLPTS